eukprot:4061885-Amphidinium_carterae.1
MPVATGSTVWMTPSQLSRKTEQARCALLSIHPMRASVHALCLAHPQSSNSCLQHVQHSWYSPVRVALDLHCQDRPQGKRPRQASHKHLRDSYLYGSVDTSVAKSTSAGHAWQASCISSISTCESEDSRAQWLHA